ncbi:MAG: adenylyltransferase/cytidyltransferase family protein, partial [Desulfovibrio sp.]|nr:adenylyltransferase/cytidyltransferase family protein [Desulfovibrio sp.]
MAKQACVTIGNFDGVHLGHQSLLNLAARIAAEKNLDFEIVTFWPHPREVLRGKASHQPLYGRMERLGLLKQAGAAAVRELPFTMELAACSAPRFVAEFLLPLGLRELVIGHDFTLGRNREGNASLLQEIGARHGFGVTRAPAFEVDGAPVSSTRLRKCLAAGDVECAKRLLGRKYAIFGKIEHGDGRGAGLGFPTANLGGISGLV